jgi:hypothetical protein
MIEISTFVRLATPISVTIVAYQVWQRGRQFTTQFEDDLDEKYRNVIYDLPLESLLDSSDSEEEYAGCLKDYYKYVELCNHQIFLRKKGRITKSTWDDWSNGIDSNFNRTDFEAAWEDINKETESFQELRQYLNPDYPDDPRYWENPRRAKIADMWYSLWNW